MTKYIMLMGTASHVGKSILAAALCRVFWRKGRKVAPFKAQNMALNSFVTADGLEMGRAQVVQAQGAKIPPQVEMNPVLLKPTGNASSQVVIMGKPVGVMSAREYHKGYSLKAFAAVKEAAAKLSAEFDTIVIEGAGSPAEVNLKDNDIVNMRVAKLLNAPVLLIADIDRGGALAAVVGTLELLDEDERALIKGIIINKFRGDVSLFNPAVEFLTKKTGKPVIGVMPHIENLGIEDEDSVSLEDKKANGTGDIDIAVIRLPKISNFTDFDSLAAEDDVNLRYVSAANELKSADLIILPGSKNTSEDLCWLFEGGMAAAIKETAAPIAGICGGYQMLGRQVRDPLHTESAADFTAGLNLLPMITTFAAEKLTSQVRAKCAENFCFLGQKISVKNLAGYEIHMGQTEFENGAAHPLVITERRGERLECGEGLIFDGRIFGTYIHGIFDNDDFRRDFLNALRIKKGLPPMEKRRNFAAERERNFERLADVAQKYLDIDKIEEIMASMRGAK